MQLTPNETTGLVPVRLLKGVGNNNAGEVCGFTPAVAQRLIAKDAAIPYEAPKADAEPKGKGK
jgi:hypothetical protein